MHFSIVFFILLKLNKYLFGEKMENKSALIIKDDENIKYVFKKSLKRKINVLKRGDVTYKVINIPANIKNKKMPYLTQDIKENIIKPYEMAVYCNFTLQNKKRFYEYFNNDLLYSSCVSYFQNVETIKKYISFKKEKINSSDIVLISDDPEKTEKIVKDICKKVLSITIYTKNTQKFKKLCDYFLYEYGIVLNLKDTIAFTALNKCIFIMLTENKEIAAELTERNADILNLSGTKIKGTYDNLYFTANNNLNEEAKLCGKFDISVLFFLFSAHINEKTNVEFMRFVLKNGVKIMKFVKND